MTIEERYRLLIANKKRQEKLDPGLGDISIINALDVLGEGLGDETFKATEGMQPETRAALATMARIAPDAIGLVGSGLKGAYDAAKRGFYDNLESIPKNFGQSGAVHGINSKLFPKSWSGQEGRFKQLQDEGLNPREIWDKAREETGFGMWDQPIYRDGQYARSDLKMNVPDINLTEGPFNVDLLGKVDQRRTYPATYFRDNPSMELGYPDLYKAGTARVADDTSMLGEPMRYQLGKQADKGKVTYDINSQADYIPATEDSLLPRFAGADQGIIQDAERFAPGGARWDKANNNLAGNVEQRAVEDEFKTILQLRGEGMDNREIISYLGDNPIFENMDTPNILQQTVPRSSLSGIKEPSGRMPNRYKQAPEPEVRTEYYPVREEVPEPEVRTEYYPVREEVPVPQPALKTEKIEKIRFPTRFKPPKKKNLTMLLDEIANYV